MACAFSMAANRRQCLDVDDDCVGAHEVDAVAEPQAPVAVCNGQWHLAQERYVAITELECQGGPIYRLEKAAAKLAVHPHRRSDDGVRLRVTGGLVGHGDEDTHGPRRHCPTHDAPRNGRYTRRDGGVACTPS
jgi:hypothetical protein